MIPVGTRPLLENDRPLSFICFSNRSLRPISAVISRQPTQAPTCGSIATQSPFWLSDRPWLLGRDVLGAPWGWVALFASNIGDPPDTFRAPEFGDTAGLIQPTLSAPIRSAGVFQFGSFSLMPKYTRPTKDVHGTMRGLLVWKGARKIHPCKARLEP